VFQVHHNLAKSSEKENKYGSFTLESLTKKGIKKTELSGAIFCG